jgi:callose synthase
MRTAVSEVWELGNYVLLKLLGPVHNDDVTYIMNYVLKWVESGTIIDHMKITKIREVVTSLVELVDVIGKGIGRRKPAANRRSTGQKKKAQEPAGPPAKGIRRSISASSLSMTTTDSAPSARIARNTIPGLGMKSSADENLVIIDALRDLTRDKFRAFLNSLKSIMISSNPESKDIMARLTFALSMENGFFWDDAYASDSLDDMARSDVCKSVLTKLQGVVACHPDEVEPKSKEVRRRLVSSIHFYLRVVH